MRIETIPLIFGVILAILGIGLVFDATTPDAIIAAEERRRKPRSERHRKGEGMVGVGVICAAAAFLGRDSWRYDTIAVIVGAILMLWGLLLNRTHLSEWLTNRGALRRGYKPKPPRTPKTPV